MAPLIFQQTGATGFGIIAGCTAGTNVNTGGTSASRLCEVDGTAGGEASITAGAGVTNARMLGLWAVPGVADWAAGTYTVRLNVTTANMNITLESVWVCRLNSGNVSQGVVGSATGLGISLATTGVQTVNVTGSAHPAAVDTDRLYIACCFTNAQTMSGQAFGVTMDQVIDTPIEAAAGTPEVTATIPLALAVGATTQTGHSATAEVPLTLDVGADAQIDHNATAGIPLGLAVDPVTQAPGVGPAEVTATIPLGLDVGAVAQAEHDVTAGIPLGLDVGATTAAPAGAGEVTATISLALAIAGSVQTEHAATADVPLALALAPAVGTDHAVTADVPLGLDVAATMQAEHRVTAQVPLLLVLDPRTIDPELVSVPVSFVVGRHPGPAGAAGSREDIAAAGLHEITINIEGVSP